VIMALTTIIPDFDSVIPKPVSIKSEIFRILFAFVTYSLSIPDSEFGDSVHLFRQGRVQYTELFNNDINNVLANISRQIIEHEND